MRWQEVELRGWRLAGAYPPADIKTPIIDIMSVTRIVVCRGPMLHPPRPYVCVRFTLLVVFVVVTVCGLDRFGRGWLL